MSTETEGSEAQSGKESQKGGEFVPPSDGSWIPKKVFDSRINELRGDLARSNAEREALAKAQVEAAKPKALTRTELNAAVADGKLTQEAADAEWERQVIATAETRAAAAAANEVRQREVSGRIEADLAEYRSLVPDAWEPGTKDRGRVAREYEALVGMGFPATKGTEVAAMRAAFGDPAAIRRSRATGRSGPAETFAETGGSAERDTGAEDKDGPPKNLEPRFKAYYEHAISQGVYKDWTEVKEELKFAKPRVRR